MTPSSTLPGFEEYIACPFVNPLPLAGTSAGAACRADADTGIAERSAGVRPGVVESFAIRAG